MSPWDEKPDDSEADNSSSNNGRWNTAFFILQLYVLPVLAAVALANNTAIVLVAALSRAFRGAIFPSVRRILLSIALADIGSVLFYHLVIWLDYALDAGIQSRQRVLCKLTRFVSYTCETASQWLLVGFTLYQIAALTWPHRTHELFTVTRVTRFILGIWLASLLVCVPVLFAFDVRQIPTGERTCGAAGARALESSFLAFGTIAQKLVVPTALLLVLTLVLVVRVVLVGRARRRSLAASKCSNKDRISTLKNSESLKSRDRVSDSEHSVLHDARLAVTLLSMTSLHVAIYAVLAVSWQLLYLHNVFNVMPSSASRNLLYHVGRIAAYAALLIRLWNFYVYFARIEGFRLPILRALSCGILVSSSAHSATRTHATRISAFVFNSHTSLVLAANPHTRKTSSTPPRHANAGSNCHYSSPSPPGCAPMRTPPCLIRASHVAKAHTDRS